MHVVSTAGHVDHGKSALVRALTGIEPDRLAEEQARGLTIDLGYAWMTLPSGDEIGIVDVPGHERFISTMLAGAGQSDVVLFVVDANEGWKPQSQEHLQILTLLGARHAVVALTKIDRCDDVDSAMRDVAEHFRGSGLEGAPIVPVSARTGDGLPQIIAAVAEAVTTAGPAPDSARPRIWLDRSFSIKGSGTVVTGTLAGGSLASGDVVEIAPAGAQARVRQIQTHGTTREVAGPVSRVALNLAGIEVAQVGRGDAAVSPGRWHVTDRIDVSLRAVGKITSRGAFKIHIGSAETDVRLTLIDETEIAAGQTAFGRLHLARALPLQPGDLFVLRDTGRRATIGGGTIVDVAPPRRARGRAPSLQARIEAISRGTISDAVLCDVGRATPVDLERWSGSATVPATAVPAGARLYDADHFAALQTRAGDALRKHHAEHPLVTGMPREALRAAAGLGDEAISDVIDAGVGIVAEGTDVRLVEHRVALTPEHVEVRARLLDALRDAGVAPPPRAETEETYGAELVGALVRAGDIDSIGTFAWSSEVVRGAKARIAEAVVAEGPLTAARIKDLLGTTRKYVIPLLEHLDATGFTRRVGDFRDIRPN